MKQTKIVCTLGPASSTVEQISQLAQNGMNVARINMSHGDTTQYLEFITAVRTVNANIPIPLGIMLDTKGAEIRTGYREHPLVVKKGDIIRFCPPRTHALYDLDFTIQVNYDGFSKDVLETNQVLVDNGELAFTINSVEMDGTVLCTAKENGLIGSRRHINLFGALVDLPTITEKDWEDIAFAVEHKVDFLAVSFIRTANDIRQIKQYLQSNNSAIQINAKIETAQAVENIIEIIQEADSIMIARGDLGAEIPYELLPSIQDRIISLCSDACKPVIVATQMLESMISHPIPTRAEITDVAHAATSLTDATMLSGETAGGVHPALVVEAMNKILTYTELNSSNTGNLRRFSENSILDTYAATIVMEAQVLKVDCIVLFSEHENIVLAVAKQRPSVPIIHISSKDMRGVLSLVYGVYSIVSTTVSKEELSPIAKELVALHALQSGLFVEWNSSKPSFNKMSI